MAYTSLEDIYKNLSPVLASGSSVSVVSRDIFELIGDMIYDSTGRAYSFKDIKKHIDEFYTKASADEKDTLRLHFHGIGDSPINVNDDLYWGDVKNANQIFVDAIAPNVAADLPDVSVFSIRGPKISPALRGAKKIDFFLNYTPPIVSAQMVPYLDVTFKTLGTSSDSITTPGIIRFLLGSGPTSTLSENDKFLLSSDFSTSHNTGSSAYGMEMFLMPQTLTNMDALGETKNQMTRLTRVKPFTPFASIEGFDIAVQNAGAGAFAHKKGNLKLKVHDKSRLSEIAEFIRGSSGFSRVSIETVYGWSAPKNKGRDDEYSNFINDNMLMKDMWQVSNTQFSFDGTGQVSLNIEMVSKAAGFLQAATVVGAETGIEKFYNAIKVIEAGKRALTEQKTYSVSVLTEKIFNAASTDGIFTNLTEQQIKSAVATLTAKADASTTMSPEERAAFKDALKTVTSAETGWSSIKTQISSKINEKFNSLKKGSDPFFPRPINNPKFKIFDSLLLENTKIKIQLNPKAKPKAGHSSQADNKSKTKKDDLSLTVGGISTFGKVFLTFIASQVSKEICNELQIFFYGLNDECGWMSGCSIAEFPIELNVLEKAYGEKVKSMGTTNMPVETFLSVIIDSHITDPAALAYGMSSFYSPSDPKKEGKRELKKDAATEKALAGFIKDYGDLKIPTIEIFVETIQTLTDNKTIKRIHIYDKQNSPYGFEQKIFDNGDGTLTIGDTDKGRLRAKQNALLETQGSDKDKINHYKKYLENYKRTGKTGNAALDEKLSSTDAADVSKSEKGVERIRIGDRGALKQYLMTKLPTLVLGTNGSLIFSANAASKTDNTQGAINMMNAARGSTGPGTTPNDGLSEVNNLPLKSVPMQVTLSTIGVPTAQLYQKYFIDFNTGTTIDNIYNCSQLQHSITQGKFVTNWTFIYDNGYGRFTNPPGLGSALLDGMQDAVDESDKKAEEAAKAAKKKKEEAQKWAEEHKS